MSDVFLAHLLGVPAHAAERVLARRADAGAALGEALDALARAAARIDAARHEAHVAVSCTESIAVETFVGYALDELDDAGGLVSEALDVLLDSFQNIVVVEARGAA